MLSGNPSCLWESAESGKSQARRKGVAFVTLLAVMCRSLEHLGREQVLPSAEAALALAESKQFSSVQTDAFTYSPELRFSPVFLGELLESQVYKLIRQQRASRRTAAFLVYGWSYKA